MVKLTDIYPVSGFVRDPKGHIARLQASGMPEVLTVNGKASVVVQDVAAYQRMLDLIEELDAASTIRARLQSLERGDPGIPAEQALRRVLKAIDGDE